MCVVYDGSCDDVRCVLVCVFMFPCLCVLFVLYGVMVYGLSYLSLLLFVLACCC